MLYDTIEMGKVRRGEARNLGNGYYSVPVLYDGKPLDFSLKNKYICVKGIGYNRDNKPVIDIHSKKYAEVVKQICAASSSTSQVLGDGSFHAMLGDMTKIVGATQGELQDAHFEACISLTFPSVIQGTWSKELQVYVKDLALIKFVSNELEFDLDKLELAD